MAEIPMTTIPHEQFLRFLGTMQLQLFKVKPLFYPASYLREVEMLEQRHFEKKTENSFTDFTE